MGVSGAGKTTLGRALAQALGWRFVEGDDLHPPANVAKMRSGTPLTDEDRAPWIAAIGRELAQRGAAGVVVSCSALRRKHRDALRAAAGDLVFVLPVLTREALESRMAARTSHFMPASLLDSQLLTYEPPGLDERVARVPGTASIEEQVASALRSLAATEQGQ